MHEKSMEQLWSTSQLAGGNLAYVEELFEAYLRDPNQVPEEWRSYFDTLPRDDDTNTSDVPHRRIREQFLLIAKNQRRSAPLQSAPVNSDHERKQVKVMQLINAYRGRGHQHATLDPLGIMERERVPDLDPHFHDLTRVDLDTVFQTGDLFIGQDEASLKDLPERIAEAPSGVDSLQ